MTDPTATGPDGAGRWPALRRQLEALAPLLRTQGSLVRKTQRGRPYWYVRYYQEVGGVRRQRSLYIGADVDAARVRAWLQEQREPAEFRRETLRLAALAMRLGRAVRR
jgi:hypothetical protein